MPERFPEEVEILNKAVTGRFRSGH